MRIAAISDIHDDIENLNNLKKLLDGFDLLLVAGDLSNGDPTEVISILKEFKIDVIVVRGNHDPLDLGDTAGLTILDYGEIVEVNGYTIMGHPFPIEDHNITGPSEDEQYYKYLEKIDKVDIVLSHSPPFGINDTIARDPETNYGSKALIKFINNKSPKLVICGHVHDYGGNYSIINNTMVINVALLNRYHDRGDSWFNISVSDKIEYTIMSL